MLTHRLSSQTLRLLDYQWYVHEDRRVAALPAQVVRNRHQETAEDRKQYGDVVRLPVLLQT